VLRAPCSTGNSQVCQNSPQGCICRKFGEVKARPPSSTADLSYILSNPLMDRALHRAEAVFQLPVTRKKEKKYGPWADPACEQGTFPALQGDADRWNSALLKTQRIRDKNPHKDPNRRLKGVPLQWVLLGITASLRIMKLRGERPFWNN
jgi:hypothetical protein